eukprot:6629463-Alexandrium_andersonii.AAC.1
MSVFACASAIKIALGRSRSRMRGRDAANSTVGDGGGGVRPSNGSSRQELAWQDQTWVAEDVPTQVGSAASLHNESVLQLAGGACSD